MKALYKIPFRLIALCLLILCQGFFSFLGLGSLVFGGPKAMREMTEWHRRFEKHLWELFE